MSTLHWYPHDLSLWSITILTVMNTFYYAHTVCSVMALIAIISAMLVIGQAVKNPVNAVLWLIVSFVAVACYLITAGMTFLGLSYIIVYVGAIAVLFLFVVMMLNIANQADLAGETQTASQSLSTNKMWPLVLLIILIGVISVLPLSQHVTFVVDLPTTLIGSLNEMLYAGNTSSTIYEAFSSSTATPAGHYWYSGVSLDQHISPFNQVQMLGLTLYTHGALWLLIVSILLMLAMIVPLALAFTA